jgi:MATE family multidrug resistance protein
MSESPPLRGERGTFSAELRGQLTLAVPLTLGYLGQMLMGLVDTLMLGHYSEAALAGAGIAGSMLFAVTAFGMGMVMGLDSLVPQALGAGEPQAARRLFWSGVRVAVVVGLPITAVVALSPHALSLASVEHETAAEARVYIYSRLPGIIPFLIFSAQRSYLQALGNTRPIVIAMVVGNLVNLVLDALTIHGDSGLEAIGLPGIGLPALGALGAGATTSVVTLGSVAIAGFAVGHLGGEDRSRVSDPALFRKITILGLPVGLQLLAEVGIFSLTAVLAGRLGKTPAAAHQIALTLASFSFSLALGVGAACSVRVGRAVGAADLAGVRRAGGVGISLGTGAMAVSACCFVLFPRQLAGLFTDEAHVIAAAVPLLRVAALFQISDAIQAVAAGALRGAGDTRSTFIANLLGHYGLGLPVAVILAFGLGLGAVGLWLGLVAGLTAVAIGLSIRFVRLTRRPIERR